MKEKKRKTVGVLMGSLSLPLNCVNSLHHSKKKKKEVKWGGAADEAAPVGPILLNCLLPPLLTFLPLCSAYRRFLHLFVVICPLCFFLFYLVYFDYLIYFRYLSCILFFLSYSVLGLNFRFFFLLRFSFYVFFGDLHIPLFLCPCFTYFVLIVFCCWSIFTVLLLICLYLAFHVTFYTYSFRFNLFFLGGE